MNQEETMNGEQAGTKIPYVYTIHDPYITGLKTPQMMICAPAAMPVRQHDRSIAYITPHLRVKILHAIIHIQQQFLIHQISEV